MTSSAGLQEVATAGYRRSPYPSLIHPHTHPDRLAAIARLAGFDPPPVQTARVLEVGVGDGLNLAAMAQALPRAEFVGFDLERDGIERGQARIAAAGLTNARLHVADLTDLPSAIDGQFDYIIAHGVYAWVPQAVADALLRMIAARLSPRGIAFVSFDALPGCYARMPLRDLVRRASAGSSDDRERVARAHAAMTRMATPGPADSKIVVGLRDIAATKLKGRTDVMLHNELGEEYRPRYLYDVLAEARSLGLRYLGDSSAEHLMEALLPDDVEADDPQRVVEERACDADVMNFRLFRRLLLMREGSTSARRFDHARVRDLYAASVAIEDEPGQFTSEGHRIRCEEPTMAAALRRLIAAAPGRIRVRDLRLPDDAIRALVDLFDFDIVALHTLPAPAATDVARRPVASPLVRAMIAEGCDEVINLDHRWVKINEGARALLPTLDGSRRRDTIAAQLDAVGVPGAAALANAARRALLVR